MTEIKLGVLGLGSRTTAFYVSELNRHFNQKKGGYSTCPFVLWNTNFDSINALLPTVSAELNALVQSEIQALEELAISHLVIPNITLHQSIDQLAVHKNILHPVYLTAAKLKEKNITHVVLVASAYTMNGTYIQSIFEAQGITIATPSEEDKKQIDAFRKLVYAEKETPKQAMEFHKIIKKYREKNIVVLACTELSIYNPKDNKNLVDMVQIQIAAAVELV